MKTLKAPENQKQFNVGLEDRELLYREWRMKLRKGHVQNIDQYEYAIIDEEIIPVSIIELSKAESPVEYPDAYFNKLNSGKGKIIQNKVVRKISESCNCPAFFVVFDDNFNRLLVQEITGENKKVRDTTPEKWGKFIANLHKKKINEYMIMKSKRLKDKINDKSNSTTE